MFNININDINIIKKRYHKKLIKIFKAKIFNFLRNEFLLMEEENIFIKIYLYYYIFIKTN